jgi:hypothetical protein
MLHHRFFSATWSRFFGRRARPDNAPPSSARAALASASAGPKSQPRPAPIPGSQDYWLALAAYRLPPCRPPSDAKWRMVCGWPCATAPTGV